MIERIYPNNDMQLTVFVIIFGYFKEKKKYALNHSLLQTNIVFILKTQYLLVSIR